MAQAIQTANLFELSCGDASVTYSTTSFTGAPHLSTSGEPFGEHTFFGAEIATADTALGTEVTVLLESIPDLRTVTMTLILPDIRVSEGEEVAFETIAVVTTIATTIAGPPPGAQQAYAVVVLHGVARIVAF
jgi:hypothetical protein